MNTLTKEIAEVILQATDQNSLAYQLKTHYDKTRLYPMNVNMLIIAIAIILLNREINELEQLALTLGYNYISSDDPFVFALQMEFMVKQQTRSLVLPCEFDSCFQLGSNICKAISTGDLLTFLTLPLKTIRNQVIEINET
jgi:hypothetical protein